MFDSQLTNQIIAGDSLRGQLRRKTLKRRRRRSVSRRSFTRSSTSSVSQSSSIRQHRRKRSTHADSRAFQMMVFSVSGIRKSAALSQACSQKVSGVIYLDHSFYKIRERHQISKCSTLWREIRCQVQSLSRRCQQIQLLDYRFAHLPGVKNSCPVRHDQFQTD